MWNVSVTLPPVRGSAISAVKLCGLDAFGLLNSAIVPNCSKCRILPRICFFQLVKVSVSLWVLIWIGWRWYSSWPCCLLLAFTGSGCLLFCLLTLVGKEKTTPISYSLSAGRMTWSWLREKVFLSGRFCCCIAKSESKGSGFRYSSVNATFVTIESALCVCLCLECLQLYSDMCLCVCVQIFFLLRCMSSWHICLFCVFWLNRSVSQLLGVGKILLSFMQ